MKTTENSPLQFDKVQYANAPGVENAAVCVACKELISDSYYEVNGQIVCPRCKNQLHGAVTGGSKAVRMISAVALGLVAAIISSIGYYFLCKISGREFAIATIAMGWFVGLAVHKGARGRGGWFYITAAVLLTYASVAFSYVPMIFENHESEGEPVAQTATVDTSAQSEFKTAEATKSQSEQTKTSEDRAMTDADRTMKTPSGENESALPPSLLLRLLALVFLIPILNAKSSPIMILIYGFGLWQAGKMNRQPHINVTGPYSTRGGTAQVRPDVATHDNSVI